MGGERICGAGFMDIFSNAGLPARLRLKAFAFAIPHENRNEAPSMIPHDTHLQIGLAIPPEAGSVACH
jgi:hypothetical protein